MKSFDVWKTSLQPYKSRLQIWKKYREVINYIEILYKLTFLELAVIKYSSCLSFSVHMKLAHSGLLQNNFVHCSKVVWFFFVAIKVCENIERQYMPRFKRLFLLKMKLRYSHIFFTKLFFFARWLHLEYSPTCFWSRCTDSHSLSLKEIKQFFRF